MQLTRVRIHPVKSVAGIDVRSARVLPWGLEGDRRWAIVDPTGTPVTAREAHALLGLSAKIARDDDALLLGSRDGAPPMRVAVPVGAEPVAVGHRRQGTALPGGEGADAWLSERIGRPLRLVWQPDPRARTVDPKNGGQPGDILTLADAGPLLLASEASVARLNELALHDALERGETDAPPLVVERFRPNLVIDGEIGAPFAEESWRHVRIGDMRFRVQGVCDRCVMTTIDPTTLERGKEPIRTLAKHRRRDGKTWFGVWLVPERDGGGSPSASEAAAPGASAPGASAPSVTVGDLVVAES